MFWITAATGLTFALITIVLRATDRRILRFAETKGHNDGHVGPIHGAALYYQQ